MKSRITQQRATSPGWPRPASDCVRRRRWFLCSAILASLCVLLFGCAEKAAPEQAAAQLAINRPLPAVISISPPAAIAGSSSVTLVITGDNFAEGALVAFGGQTYKPREVTGSQITVSIPASALAQPGARTVGVVNPEPGGGVRYALVPFQVLASAPSSPYQRYWNLTPPQTARPGSNPYPGPANPAYGQFPGGSPSGAPRYGEFPGGSPSGAPPFGAMPNGTSTVPHAPK